MHCQTECLSKKNMHIENVTEMVKIKIMQNIDGKLFITILKIDKAMKFCRNIDIHNQMCITANSPRQKGSPVLV